jgi:hypothetical protein
MFCPYCDNHNLAIKITVHSKAEMAEHPANQDHKNDPVTIFNDSRTSVTVC